MPRFTSRVNFLIARALGAVVGTGLPDIFTTLARHRRLFHPWLRFAGAPMPGGWRGAAGHGLRLTSAAGA